LFERNFGNYQNKKFHKKIKNGLALAVAYLETGRASVVSGENEFIKSLIG